MFEHLKHIYEPFIKKEIIGPIIVVVVALFLYRLVKRFTKKIFTSKKGRLDERKSKTIISVVNNVGKYFILLIAILSILEIYGVETSGILASLGIVGVVAGLAVQDMLKDILSGVSIIVENQYAVGDVITVGDFKGEVISLGLRTTRLKAYTGEIKIIANRNITEVVNYSMSKSLAIVNIPVAYHEDIDHVEEVLSQLCARVKQENKAIKGQISCIGITSFDSSSINFRIVAEVEVLKHYDIERILLKEVKKEFDKEKIEIPYNQVVVHHA